MLHSWMQLKPFTSTRGFSYTNTQWLFSKKGYANFLATRGSGSHKQFGPGCPAEDLIVPKYLCCRSNRRLERGIMIRHASMLLLVLVGFASASSAGHVWDGAGSRSAGLSRRGVPDSLSRLGLRGTSTRLALRGGEQGKHQYGLRYTLMMKLM